MPSNQGDMDSSNLSFPANIPHFFTIILSHNFPGTGIRIPNKFMREQGKNMSNRVCLHVPDGELWQVELTNNMNGTEVWLKKGWRQFADYYSISYGHFLVFGYEGNSVFSVIIFDHSATEIKYPTIQKINRDFQKGAQSIETDDHSARMKSPVAYILRRKKAKMDSVLNSEEGKLDEEFKGYQTKTDEAMKMEEKDTCLQEASVKKDLLISNFGDNMAMEMKTRGIDHASKCTNAIRLADSFISTIKKNPFFVITLQPSYVSSRYSLNVPRSFVARYLSKKHKHCTFLLSDGRSWSVDCLVYSRSAKLDKGWQIFAEDNGLTVGDICVFELISNIHNLFKISIFRGT